MSNSAIVRSALFLLKALTQAQSRRAKPMILRQCLNTKSQNSDASCNVWMIFWCLPMLVSGPQKIRLATAAFCAIRRNDRMTLSSWYPRAALTIERCVRLRDCHVALKTLLHCCAAACCTCPRTAADNCPGRHDQDIVMHCNAYNRNALRRKVAVAALNRTQSKGIVKPYSYVHVLCRLVS
jgi:hypothetical protein